MKNSILRLFLLVLSLSYISNIQSQVVVGDACTLVTGSESVFTLGTDFINNGSISHNGRFICYNNWENNSSFNGKYGTLELLSESEQIISHNAYSIGELIIENSSDKLFISDMAVSTHLDLESGYIVPSEGVVFKLLDSCEILGGSEESNIRGTLYHQGYGNKYYPISNNSAFSPAYLNIVDATQAIVGLKVTEANNSTKAGMGLDELFNNRYWQLDINSGSVENAMISLYCKNEDFDDVSLLVIAEAHEPTGVYTSLGARTDQSFLPDYITSSTPISKETFMLALSSNILISNIITPNGDGINDNLFISNIQSCTNNELSIFNRLGQVVYSTTNYNNNWSGDVGGHVLPNGSYICVFSSSCSTEAITQTFSILH